MAYTITLSAADSHALETVRAAVTDLALRDPDFNGANIRVERGSHTAVDGPDELAGARLLAYVVHALEPIDE